MDKELEALGLIKKTCELYIERTSYLIGSDIIEKQIKEALNTIESALRRLEAIDDTKPSKTLKDLNEIIEYITEDKKVKYKATILFDCEIIKDTLLKAQEQEKENKKLKNLIKVINEFGANNFDIFKKIELYNLTNGELFNTEEVLHMIELRKKVKEKVWSY